MTSFFVALLMACVLISGCDATNPSSSDIGAEGRFRLSSCRYGETSGPPCVVYWSPHMAHQFDSATIALNADHTGSWHISSTSSTCTTDGSEPVCYHSSADDTLTLSYAFDDSSIVVTMPGNQWIDHSAHLVSTPAPTHVPGLRVWTAMQSLTLSAPYYSQTYSRVP